MLVEFSLVTHASDSLHMNVVLQYLLLLLVNPKLCSCLFVCFIFSCPPNFILVWWQEMCVTPSATSWSPAGQEEKVREEDECVWVGEGVTLQMVPLTREKRPDEKKLEMIGRGNRKKMTDERKKKKKNAIRTRNQRDREKRKRKREKQRKKKDGKERNLQR